jgi:hypothetical protein
MKQTVKGIRYLLLMRRENVEEEKHPTTWKRKNRHRIQVPESQLISAEAGQFISAA